MPQTEVWRLMLSGLSKSNIWPALLGQVEVNSCWCNVDQTVTMIQCEVVVRLALEVAEHLRVVTFNPACCCYVDGLELAFDIVFIT